MSVARVEVLGTRIRLSGPSESSLPLDEATRELLSGWVSRYRTFVENPTEAEALVALGRELFDWLDASGWASQWLEGPGPRLLEVTAASSHPSTDEVLVTSLPWEVLAMEAGFLAADGLQLYEVWRRIGRAEDAKVPSHRDLSLLFMAAAPRGGGARLAFEAEEAGILAATERLGLGLTVEETGCLEFLRERFLVEGSHEALHLSCHGGLAGKSPVLQLETAVGDPELVTPEQLADAWGETPPHLVFLSACRTAQAPSDLADSYARALTRVVPAVVGWDGAVGDRDAIEFSEVFYRNLAGYSTPGFAVAKARKELLLAHLNNPRKGRDWHLARLWLGTHGGGPLVKRDLPGRRVLPRDAGTKAFLDAKRNRVRVAGADVFVGRRREAQQVLRSFRDNSSPGVLIHGMGNLGKSSLAARVAGRLPDLETVVVFGDYDPMRLLEQICAAAPPRDRAELLEGWRPRIDHNPGALADAVEDLLAGPFTNKPILLVVDDLEQILEPPTPQRKLTRVLADYGWATSVVALLSAFHRSRGRSRLLFTSRYDFTAMDSTGWDLASQLVRVPLTPFDPEQRTLQWRSSQEHSRRQGTDPNKSADTGTQARELLGRILDVAGGNPGLQDVLTKPLLANQPDIARHALETIERYFQGESTTDSHKSEVTDFLKRMTFEVYLQATTDLERQLLAAAVHIGAAPDLSDVGLGTVPLPLETITEVGRVLGLDDPTLTTQRLVGLGLLDDYQSAVVGSGFEGLAVNPLAVPLLTDLDQDTQRRMAKVTFESFRQAWNPNGGDWPRDPRSILATRAALLADEPIEAQRAALAALNLLFDDLGTAAGADLTLRLGTRAVEDANRIEAESRIDLVLVRRLCEVANRLGKTKLQQNLLEIGLSANTSDDKAKAQLQTHHAERLASVGDPENALTLLAEALEIFQQLGDIRSEAITRGQIADILQARGQLDEALHIRQTEQLPVYQQLGDIRSETVTRGKIADILQARGQLDEALHIRQTEQLPVYQQLGDIREEAITRGQIADILQARGQLDEALHIRQTEELPVYQQLGDIRSEAITCGQIADILQARGQLDEALHIRQTEELPVYQQLGDIRSETVTRGQIADILQARGQLDEALHIRQTEQLPVYQQLGDIRSEAITRGQIADILQARGQLDEALHIRQTEELPVYQQLGDIRSKAAALFKIANALMETGSNELDTILDALRRSFELNLHLGAPDGIGVVGLTLAQLLIALDEQDQAYEVLEHAHTAFAKLDWDDGVARCQELRARLDEP